MSLLSISRANAAHQVSADLLGHDARPRCRYHSAAEIPSCGGLAPTGETEVLVTCKSGFQRYCEFLVVTYPASRPYFGKSISIAIWNTIGCNDCDQSQLDGVSFTPTLLTKGARLWLMDSIVQTAPPSGAVGPTGYYLMSAWNGLGSQLAGYTTANLTLQDTIDWGAPYTTNEIERQTVWRYRPKRQVYQLVNGSLVYTMQTTPANISAGDLLTLGQNLTLPTGWTYRCRVLGENGLDVKSNEAGIATTLYDDLDNAYQLVTESDYNSCKLYSDKECIEETDDCD